MERVNGEAIANPPDCLQISSLFAPAVEKLLQHEASDLQQIVSSDFFVPFSLLLGGVSGACV